LTRLRSWDFVVVMPRRAAPDRSIAGRVGRAGLLASGLLVASLAGCKERGSSDQDSRPLPAPEPPATSAAAPLPRDEPASPKRRPVDEADDAKKRPAATDTPAKPAEPVGEPTGADTPAPAPDAGGSAPNNPTPTPSALPTPAAPSAACLSRCQGAMQSCLSAPVDGGVPGFGNLELCKKAFEACQAACK
jgi:hypothetical protein